MVPTLLAAPSLSSKYLPAQAANQIARLFKANWASQASSEKVMMHIQVIASSVISCNEAGLEHLRPSLSRVGKGLGHHELRCVCLSPVIGTSSRLWTGGRSPEHSTSRSLRLTANGHRDACPAPPSCVSCSLVPFHVALSIWQFASFSWTVQYSKLHDFPRIPEPSARLLPQKERGPSAKSSKKKKPPSIVPGVNLNGSVQEGPVAMFLGGFGLVLAQAGLHLAPLNSWGGSRIQVPVLAIGVSPLCKLSRGRLIGSCVAGAGCVTPMFFFSLVVVHPGGRFGVSVRLSRQNSPPPLLSGLGCLRPEGP
jgi:hypothetical protein